MVRQPDAGAGSCQLSRGSISPMDASQQSSGFRLFRSQHSCVSRRSVYDLSWTGRSNANDVARKHAIHGVVPAMSSSSGALHSDVRQNRRHSKQAYELLGMSSMKTERFWRTLEEYSNFEEFQKSLSDEFP